MNAETNRQNARDLFDGHLQTIFDTGGTGWEHTTIGAAIRFIDYRGKTPPKTADGIRLITAKNVKMGYLQKTPMEFIASASYKAWMTRGIPQKGDVLFTTEAPLANVAQLDTDERVAFAQRIIIMQADASRLDSTFLKYLLLSQPVQQRIRTKGTGATVQGIKASLLKTIEISFPKSLADQRRYAEQLDCLAEQTQHLAGLYERTLAALEALKQSLLHQAFSGQLSADSPFRRTSPAPVTRPVSALKITATDLHAGILAMAYQLHDERGKVAQFTHVKAEKIAHMVEVTAGLDLGRTPVKDAAGPNDFPHLLKVEHRARRANYFDFKRGQSGTAYRVQKLSGFNRLLDRTREALGESLGKVENTLNWMLRLTVQQAEIVATVYAAWNNLLLEGKSPNDDEIVYESRENWHPNKLKIDRQRFLNAVEWLRKERVVPQGTGKLVSAKGGH